MLGIILSPIAYGIYWFAKADHDIHCHLAQQDGYKNLPTCD